MCRGEDISLPEWEPMGVPGKGSANHWPIISSRIVGSCSQQHIHRTTYLYRKARSFRREKGTKFGPPLHEKSASTSSIQSPAERPSIPEKKKCRNAPDRSEYENLDEEYGVWVGDSVEKVAVP